MHTGVLELNALSWRGEFVRHDCSDMLGCRVYEYMERERERGSRRERGRINGSWFHLIKGRESCCTAPKCKVPDLGVPRLWVIERT